MFGNKGLEPSFCGLLESLDQEPLQNWRPIWDLSALTEIDYSLQTASAVVYTPRLLQVLPTSVELGSSAIVPCDYDYTGRTVQGV